MQGAQKTQNTSEPKEKEQHMHGAQDTSEPKEKLSFMPGATWDGTCNNLPYIWHSVGGSVGDRCIHDARLNNCFYPH